MPPTVRRPLAVAVLLALAAAAVPAQDTRPIAESAPASRIYRPPGRTYPMPGRDMGQRPVEEWASPAALKDFGVDLAKRLLPNDAGAVWIGVLTMILVGAAWRPFRARRNLECVLLLALAPFYVHLIDRQSTLDDAPQTRGAYVICFTAIYLLTAWWWLRGLVGSRAAPPAEADSASGAAAPRRPVKAIALGLVALNAFLIAVRPPDDCGHYTNLGAQRMLERKSWPYGDEKLLGGAAATYGPVLYVVNAGVLALRPDATPNAPDAFPDKAWGYVNPPLWAAKTVVALFHGAALFALYLIGRRLRDAATGWTLVALYAGSPYVLGLGGEATSVTGLGYISHIGPTATILLAFAALPMPFLAGVLLNVAIGTGYFPAFFWPAWSAYFGTRKKGDGLKFQLGFFATGAVLIAALWFGTERAGGRNPIELFLEGSIAHQEAPDQYGSSTLSFFGAHPAAKATIRAPLFGEKARMVTPVFLLAAGMSLAGFWLGRRRTPAQLAFLTASTIACVQLWKHHASGTYVEWYYPLLLIGVFANAPEKPKDERPPEPAAPIPAHA